MAANHAMCLGHAGLAVFTATADQRFLLGPDVFMRTHFPIILRRFPAGRDPQVISEESLLAQLLAPVSASQGNRVFVLYGAAGSGKSELLRWVQTRLEREVPLQAEATVRVARTDLDALSISERFRRLLDQGYFDEVTHRRWQMARKKPRALTKLVVLSALESLLDDDSAINALFYRLTNVVEPHMAQCLGAQQAPAAVDILSREAWEEIIADTALPVPVEYEPLRHQMLAALQSHLLEGLNLPQTLRLISEHVAHRHGRRPILLVDDLVQSLNLFATDILDYFVTLESGQWDVILGLTPAAFEATRRGRELLQRIAYLDTLDDRLTKLWLSDDAGTESYFLDEESCVPFAAQYLAEHRRLNAVEQPITQTEGRCITPGPDSFLCPFNRPVLVRLFRGIPIGKGKARHFLTAVRDALERLGQGMPLASALNGLVKEDAAALCSDLQVARAAELYGPLVTSRGPVTLGEDLVRFWGIGETAITLEMEPLTQRLISRSSEIRTVDDEEKAAIHDWLLGRQVNRQLLKGLRRGTARWLRAVIAPDLLYRDGVAKPHGVLRWEHTCLDTSPCICLEGVDDLGQGVLLEREIGPLAFELHRYATAIGIEAQHLLSLLVGQSQLLSAQLAAAALRRKAIHRLEGQLAMRVEALSWRLYVLLMVVEGQPIGNALGFSDAFWTEIELTRARLLPGVAEFAIAQGDAIRRLFDDWFKLRENLFDGPAVARLLDGSTCRTALEPLLSLKPDCVDKDYWLGARRLGTVLSQACAVAEHLLISPPHARTTLSWVGQRWLDRVQGAGAEGLQLSELPVEVLGELQASQPDLCSALRVIGPHQTHA